MTQQELAGELRRLADMLDDSAAGQPITFVRPPRMHPAEFATLIRRGVFGMVAVADMMALPVSREAA